MLDVQELPKAGAASDGSRQWLLVLESPGAWLARVLPEWPEPSAEAALAEWVVGANLMLRHVRRLRAHTAVVCIDEWLGLSAPLQAEAPDSLPGSDSLRAWSRLLAATLAHWPDPASVDPLVRRLSASAAASHAAASSLHVELLAASESPPASTLEHAQAGSHESNEALGLLEGLLANRRAAAQEHTRLMQAITALQEAGRSAQAQRQTLQEQAARVQAERDELHGRALRAERDAQDLLEQLHRSQEQLELLLLKSKQSGHANDHELKAAGVRLNEAEARARLASERARTLESQLAASAGQARDDLQRLGAALRDRENAADQIAGQLRSLQQELDLVRQQGQRRETAHAAELAAHLSRERDAAARLGDAQLRHRDEVARMRSERRALEASLVEASLRLSVLEDSMVGRPMRLDDDAAVARLGRLELGQPGGTGVHRHLDLSLQDAEPPTGRVARLRVRLVDHRGMPGLALLRSAHDAPPIGGWVSHGHEGGDAYCLLIPGDRQSARLWQHLGAGDWRFLMTLVLTLDASLLDAATARQELGPWHKVVRQLRMQLWNIAPRLRYDAVEVFGEQAADGQVCVRMEFRGAVYGWNELGTVTLWWRANSDYDQNPELSTVACSALGSDGRPAPLWSAWPRTSDGQWAAKASLPVGPRMDAATRRQLWASLPAPDRQLMLSLLDAMPAARDATGVTVPPQTATIGQAARRLHKQARRTMLQLELRRVARGLMRR